MSTVYCIRDYVYMDGVVKWKGGKYYKYLKSMNDLFYVYTDIVGFYNYDTISEFLFDRHFLDIETSRDRKIDEILKYDL